MGQFKNSNCDQYKIVRKKTQKFCQNSKSQIVTELKKKKKSVPKHKNSNRQPSWILKGEFYCKAIAKTKWFGQNGSKLIQIGQI